MTADAPGAPNEQAGAPVAVRAPSGGRTTIGEAAALGIVSSAASLLLTIARSKVTALVLGPTGLGKSAEIIQLVTLANLPATIVTGPALVIGVAETEARGDADASARIVHTATVTALGISAIAAVAATVAGYWILPREWGRSAWPLTMFAGAAALFTSWAAVAQQVLTARGQLGKLALIRLLVGVTGTAIVVGGTLAFALTGQFVASLVAALASLAIVRAVAGLGRGARPAPGASRFDRRFLARAVQLGLAALIAGAASQGALFAIREALEANGGAAANGQFQAAWALGTTYFTFILDSIGAYVFPRYAAAATSAELAREMDEATRFVFKMAPPAILCAIAFRAPVVHALYSHRFDGAVELVGLQMVGDIARAAGWVQAGPLLYRQRIRAFMLVEFAASLGLVASALWWVPVAGLRAVGYASIAINVGYVLLTAVVVSRSCGVPVRISRILGVLAGTAVAYLALLLTNTFASARWVILAVVLLWWHKVGVLRAIDARVRRVLRTLANAYAARRHRS